MRNVDTLLMGHCLVFLVLLLGRVTTVARAQAAVVDDEGAELPKYIHLHAGVLHAPPFAVVENGPSFLGFQPDLLNRVKIFAWQDDGIILNVTLEESPRVYNDALNLVASDCREVVSPSDEYGCDHFDLIVGDYYTNPDRSLRVDFTPPMLRTTMTTIKSLENSRVNTPNDYTTLAQAELAGATVCVPEGTYLMTVVMEKFPHADYLICRDQDDCLDQLKSEACVLYADDELQLRHRAANDATLQVTREQFNTQYTVWPMADALPATTRRYMKRWLYAAISNATVDALFFQYFKKELCPVGTAGAQCELDCHPVHGTADEDGECQCSSTRWTGPDCATEVQQDLNLIPTWLQAVVIGMFAVTFFSCLFCAFWLYRNRKAPQVRLSQPFFLNLVLLGCLISSSTVIPMAAQDEGDGPVPACQSIPWLYSIGFSITFGTLFAKISRIYRVFRSATSMKRKVVTFRETLAMVGIILIADASILIAWSIYDPLRWQRRVLKEDVFGYPLESKGFCSCDSWFVFGAMIAVLHLSLLGFGSYLCFVARDVPGDFSESKYVAIAILSNLQIFIVGLPVLALVGTDPASSFFVRSAVVWMNDFVVLVLIFGNLIRSDYKSRRESHENLHISAHLGNAMRQYRRSQAQRDGSLPGTPAPLSPDGRALWGERKGVPSSLILPAGSLFAINSMPSSAESEVVLVGRISSSGGAISSSLEEAHLASLPSSPERDAVSVGQSSRRSGATASSAEEAPSTSVGRSKSRHDISTTVNSTNDSSTPTEEGPATGACSVARIAENVG